MVHRIKIFNNDIPQILRDGIKAFREKNGEDPVVFATADVWIELDHPQKNLEIRKDGYYFEGVKICMVTVYDSPMQKGFIYFVKDEPELITWEVDKGNS